MKFSDLDWAFIDERAENFAGRDWVFAEVRRFLAAPRGTMLLLGSPGSGKTAVAARIVQASADVARLDPPPPKRAYAPVPPDTLHAAYFCRARQVKTLDCAQKLSDQLAEAVPEFAEIRRQLLGRAISIRDVKVRTGKVEAGASVAGVHIDLSRLGAARAFAEGVDLPLQRLREQGYRKRIVVLIDALDEARADADDLPNLIRDVEDAHLIVTTRPDRAIVSLYENRAAKVLDLVRDAPRDVDDVAAYCAYRFSQIQDSGARAALSHRIGEEAKGIFLYAFYVVGKLLSEGAVRPESTVEELAKVELPRDQLPGVYREFLLRVLGADHNTWWASFAPVLGPIAVAHGSGLSTENLVAIASRLSPHPLRTNEIRRVTTALSQFLEGRPPDGPFRPYHHTFAEFLIDPEQNPDFCIDPVEAREAVVEYFLGLTQDPSGRIREAATASVGGFQDQFPPQLVSRTLDRLVEMTSDPVHRVQRAATDSLAALRKAIPEGEVAPLLARLYALTRGPDDTQRRTAAFALKALRGIIPKSEGLPLVDCLLGVTTSPHAVTRRAGVLTLGEIRELIPPVKISDVVDRLVELTADDGGVVRAASAWSIAELRDVLPGDRAHTILDRVFELTEDLDGDVRATAIIAFAALTRQGGNA